MLETLVTTAKIVLSQGPLYHGNISKDKQNLQGTIAAQGKKMLCDSPLATTWNAPTSNSGSNASSKVLHVKNVCAMQECIFQAFEPSQVAPPILEIFLFRRFSVNLLANQGVPFHHRLTCGFCKLSCMTFFYVEVKGRLHQLNENGSLASGIIARPGMQEE
jgi:hypothetical protein